MFKGLLFFLREGWKYDRRYVLWLFFDQLLSSLMPVAAALMPGAIISELAGARRMERLMLYTVAFALYALIAGALHEYFSRDGFSRRCRVNTAFDHALCERLTRADYSNLESPAFRDMQEKARKFLYCDWHGFGYLLDCAVGIVGQVVTLVALAAILSTLNGWFVLLFAALAALSARAESRAQKRAMELSMGVVANQRGMTYYSNLFDDAACGKELRLNNMGIWLLARWRRFSDRCNDAIARQNNLFIRAGVIRSALTFVQQIAAYGFLIAKTLSGSLGVGAFSMCAGAVTSFSDALRRIMKSLSEIRAYDMYYDKLDEYLSVPCAMREGKRLPLPEGPHEIVFDNVSFRYPGADGWALRRVSLTLHPGEKLALAGENGSGKTTLVKLLCRLYDPTEGEIRLDGVNIRDIDYDAYLSLFSAVFQDFRLFDFSLRDNVTLGRAADDAAVESALRRAGLDGRLASLPNGLDTFVGRAFDEHGFQPSGGEAQKIALARALFRNAPIIVLDEPAAALDPRAEYEMYRAFDALVDGKTALYISHRLSSARFCDRIAVMDAGRVAEYGAHDELIALGGRYAALYAMQAQFYL
ncbi:MAG: ABC transporter ATP-binding protein [Clostridia bacterium]|nr:ABC transporter ATP-binding protein [Clostridia bacterium]